MRIVIDEDLPRSLAHVLQERGYHVFDIRDHGLRGKSDADIFTFAQKQKAVLLSADLGFGNIFTFPLDTHYGIIILRFPHELSTSAVNTIVVRLLGQLSEDDVAGNLIILTPQGIRLRRKQMP